MKNIVLIFILITVLLLTSCNMQQAANNASNVSVADKETEPTLGADEYSCNYMHYLGGISRFLSNELYSYLRLEFLPADEEIVCEFETGNGQFVYYEHGRMKTEIDGKMTDTIMPASSEDPKEYRKSILLQNGDTAFWTDRSESLLLSSETISPKFCISGAYKKGDLYVGYTIIALSSDSAGWNAEIVKDVLFDENAETGVSREVLDGILQMQTVI